MENNLSNRISNKAHHNNPLARLQNSPLELLVQSNNNHLDSKRRYTTHQMIDGLAIEKYKRTGKGISFNDLIRLGLARHKRQAQDTLKRFRERKILFTIENHKPQHYYPISLKAEIFKARLSKNTPIRVTELPLSQSTHLSTKDATVLQTLEGYILPILHNIPVHILKIQLRLEIRSEYYSEIPLHVNLGNKSKEYQEIVGPGVLVRYLFYPNGRVMVFTESSNNPFRLETEEDLVRLIAFLGAVRDRLVVFLHDRHERIVPDIMQWYLTQCDINRDVRISDWLQFTGLNIQVRHALRLFRIYIKSKGKDTLCRIEESINLKNKSAVEAINDIFNPYERLEIQIGELGEKIDRVVLSHCVCCNINLQSTNCVPTRNINEEGGPINC